MKKLELLAPARNLETGRAAINQGADAVYIGAPAFGARKAAANSIEDIEKLCNFAHLFNSKVYVTLNTLIFDNELDEVRLLIHQLYNIGIDALIIQDFGILEMDLPPIVLHASTQMNNFTPEKIKFLEKVGIQRAILARELSLEQIRQISSQTNIELEFFIHGALCVSMSGQCYASHAVTGRSANRGECAQICRSAFNLTDTIGNTYLKNKHLLSLKDLNLTESIPQLIDAGITTFKIEGRLKDIAYVKNNVAHYRKILDSYILQNPNYQKASDGIVGQSFQPDPERTFTRGFTNYFISGRNKSISSFSSQKSVGKYLGKIVQIGSNYFVLNNSSTRLIPGDGLCFICKEGSVSGAYVNRVEQNKIYPSEIKGIQCGTEVYRNFDKIFTEQLEQEEQQRRIPVKLTFSSIKHGFKLEIQNCNGTNATQEILDEKQIAEDKTKALSNIKNQLSKLGNSIYEVSELHVNVKEIPFIQVSKLNNLRRIVCEKLDKERIKAYKRNTFHIIPNNEPYPENELDYRANITNKLSEAFYERHQAKIVEKGFELLEKEIEENKPLMYSKHCVKYEVNACTKVPGNKRLPATLFLTDNANRYRLEFDCKECIMKVYLAKKAK